MIDYRNSKTVVIGGTHGMGLATARALIAGGSHVIVTGSSENNVVAAQAELGKAAHVVRSDITAMADIDALASLAKERFGALDAVFVFAAIAEFSPIEEVDEASFDRQFAVNAKGAFFALKRLVPLVRDGGGMVLTTVTPATASPSMGVYMATKAAVRAFAQVAAAELLPRNIRVNTLAPGFIDTPTLGLATLSPEAREAFRAVGDAVTPMKRHGTVEEVARAALYLAFEATFTTGAELPVDGGLSQVDAPAD